MDTDSLARLARLAGGLPEADSPGRVMRALAGAALEATGAGGAAVVWREPGGTARLGAVAGALPELTPADLEALAGDPPATRRGVLAEPLSAGPRRLGSLAVFGAGEQAARSALPLLAAHGGVSLANAGERRRLAGLHSHTEQVEALEQAKTRFLDLAGHELRTPLAVLRGYLAMMEDGSISTWEGVQRALPALSARARRMDGLVTRMLEISRLEGGRLDLSIAEADLCEVAEEAVEGARGGSSKHELVVQRQAADIPVAVDRLRIGIAVGNLIENAVKYSPGGGRVQCSVRREGEMGVVEVSDQGVGISRQELGRLFRRFGRIDNERTRGIPGTGLGLYLCREIARRHGGEVTVRSRPGRGTVFALRLPVAASAAVSKRRPPAAREGGRRRVGTAA